MQYHAGNLEQDGFHCYFQIVAPSDVKWQPVFTGSKENYQIRVYLYNPLNEVDSLVFDSGENVENELKNNLSACQPNEWYHIVVFPLSDDGAGTTDVEFGITYYQEWTDQYINLYVNGEYNHIRWPNSGDNPKLIKIKHVSALQGNSETN